MAFSTTNYNAHAPIPFTPVVSLSHGVLASQDDEFDGRDLMEVFGLPALVQRIHSSVAPDVPPPPQVIQNEFSSIREYAEVMQSHVMMEHDAVLKEILDMPPRRVDELYDDLPPSARLALERHSENQGRFNRSVRPTRIVDGQEAISLALNLVRTMPSREVNFVLTHSEPTPKSTLSFLKAVPRDDFEVYSLEYCGAAIASFNACHDVKTSEKLQASNPGLTLAIMMPLDGNVEDCDREYWAPVQYPNDFLRGKYVGIGEPLNMSQNEAVQSMFRPLECVHGPPGTGKSTLISAVIAARVPDTHSALVVCVRNRAVDAVAGKLRGSSLSTLVIGNPKRLGLTSRELILKERVTNHPWMTTITDAINLLSKIFSKGASILDALNERLDSKLKHLSSERHHDHLPSRLLFMSSRPLVRDKWRQAFRLVVEAYRMRRYPLLVKLRSMMALLDKILARLHVQKDQWGKLIARKIVSETRVFLSTIDSAYSLTRLFSDYEGVAKPLHSVIVDEAGCVPEYNMPLLLRLQPAAMLLVGDPRQLRPFTRVNDLVNSRMKHSHSLLERAEDCKLPLHLLNVQYRMINELGWHVSNLFYENKLETCVLANDLRGVDISHSGLLWLHCDHPRDPGPQKSPCNEGEASQTVKVALAFRRRYPQRRIYVLSFYRLQMRLLTRKLVVNNTPFGSTFHEESVNLVCTVDSAQGDEADIVIVSLTQSVPNKFLCDMNRLCVSFSRARTALVLVGNRAGFKGSDRSPGDRVWRHIEHHAKPLPLDLLA